MGSKFYRRPYPDKVPFNMLCSIVVGRGHLQAPPSLSFVNTAYTAPRPAFKGGLWPILTLDLLP